MKKARWEIYFTFYQLILLENSEHKIMSLVIPPPEMFICRRLAKVVAKNGESPFRKLFKARNICSETLSCKHFPMDQPVKTYSDKSNHKIPFELQTKTKLHGIFDTFSPESEWNMERNLKSWNLSSSHCEHFFHCFWTLSTLARNFLLICYVKKKPHENLMHVISSIIV